MKLKKLIIVFMTVTSLLLSSLANAETKTKGTFTPEQKTAIEGIVRTYLIKNPEVLIQMSRALKQLRQQEAQKKVEGGIKANAKQLFDSNSPTAGNAKGKLVLVEFYDYQCGHCREMTPILSKLIAKNKDLKVIYKIFPIFGASSMVAARAALAAQKQGKFNAFHDALFKEKRRLSPQKIMVIAKSVGINREQLKKDMGSATVSNELTENLKLARSLGLKGTPAFIIANRTPENMKKPAFISGAANLATVQRLINQMK